MQVPLKRGSDGILRLFVSGDAARAITVESARMMVERRLLLSGGQFEVSHAPVEGASVEGIEASTRKLKNLEMRMKVVNCAKLTSVLVFHKVLTRTHSKTRTRAEAHNIFTVPLGMPMLVLSCRLRSTPFRPQKISSRRPPERPDLRPWSRTLCPRSA